MIHLDLFSGIGGFARAVDAVWPGAEHTFCEIDAYCQALLKLRYPKARIYGDIRQLTADSFCQRLQRNEQREAFSKNKGSSRPTTKQIENADILTAGVPCQPASCAGKRGGTKDSRWLWPDTFRIIREVKPIWCILENVRGLLTLEKGLVFESLLSELEAEGYETQAFIIPAVSVNAPHKRDRVWIVANTGHGHGQGTENRSKPERQIPCEKNASEPERSNSNERKKLACHATSVRRNIGKRDRQAGQILSTQVGEDKEDKQKRNRRLGRIGKGDSDWNKPWLEVATRLCGVDDGLPAGVDGFELSKAKHRVERLKALGNAIVPQVAIEIMKGIKDAY